MESSHTGEMHLKSFKNIMASGELHEVDVAVPFGDILATIDQRLFPKEGRSLHQSWRTQDVFIGKYIPPAVGKVPRLMEAYADKVHSIMYDVRPDYYSMFVAWAAWTLINIHPKRDGNGRFSQAVAEYLLRDHDVLGYWDQMWNMVFIASDRLIVDQIAEKQGRSLPDVPDPPKDSNERQKWWRENRGTLLDFYRCKGHDYSAEVLEEAINDTKVDKDGRFYAGGPRGALGMMEEFVSRTPLKSINSR